MVAGSQGLETKVIQELRRIFSQLDAGMAASQSPEKLTKLLALEVSTQQDPLEFSSLFLNMIERCFVDSGDARLQSVFHEVPLRPPPPSPPTPIMHQGSVRGKRQGSTGRGEER